MSIKPKIGVMSFITPQKIWPEHQLKKARIVLDVATKALEKQNIEAIHPGEITRTHQQGYEQALKLKQNGAQGLIIYAGFWLYSSAVAATFDAAKLPVIIWTSTSIEDAGLVGASISRGTLEALGHPTQLVVGDFDDDSALAKIGVWAGAAHARAWMQGKTYTRFGGRSLGMYTGMIDELEWRNKFGIEVEDNEQLEVVEYAKKIPQKRIDDMIKWMKRYFGKVKSSKEVSEKSCRLHLAFKDIMHERKYDFCGIKCLTELPAAYCSACVAHSLLNDGFDFEGSFGPYICACECDNNGALSMIFLKGVSGETVVYADVRAISEERELMLCNCGSQATSLAKTAKDVIWQDQAKINGPGLASTYICKPGKVTLCRASRINREYHLFILTGTAKDEPVERLKAAGDVGSVWPHAFIDIDGTREDFISQLRSNHMHFVYGDYKSELIELCKMLDIKVITI